MASPVSTSITIGSATQVDPVQTQNQTITPIPANVQIQPANLTPVPTNNTVAPANNTVINPPAPANNTTIPTQNQIRVANESGKDMPYAGTESEDLAKIIIGVILIGLVLYIKIQRMDKEV